MLFVKVFVRYDQGNQNKLGNLISDIKVASQIDINLAWMKDPKNGEISNIPINQDGKPINESTYERVSWFIKGAQLLRENPLGSGFSHLAFRYYMLKENPNLMLYKTHSGWIDYALGVGIPGLIMTWLAMGLVGWRSLISVRSGSLNSGDVGLSIPWMMGGIWLLWWVSEVSEREFIEYLFFAIALFGGILACNEKSALKESA
jgi:hypothetical protein